MKKYLIALAVTLSALVSLSPATFAASSTAASATPSASPSKNPSAVSSPTPSKAPSTASSAAKKETYTVANAGVYVRSGPGTSYSKLGMLDKGAKETGIVTNGWLEFTYNGKSAYCSAKYLSNDADTVTTAATSSAKALTYQVNASQLKVRSGPGTSYSTLGKLEKGAKETGVVEDGWLKFTYNNVTAYCSATYLTPEISSDKS